jgi:hypothetical protein
MKLKLKIASNLFICLFISTSCNLQFSNPELTVFKDSISFNSLKKSDTFTHKFFLVNTGSSSLKIINIQSSCGCANASIRDSIIFPGDSLPLVVNYIPSKNNDEGFVKKIFVVRTNCKPALKPLIVAGKVI